MDPLPIFDGLDAPAAKLWEGVTERCWLCITRDAITSIASCAPCLEWLRDAGPNDPRP